MTNSNEQENSNNRISEQSREAWEKYGDKAAEKGFAYEREGEGLPDENNELTPNPAKNLADKQKSQTPSNRLNSNTSTRSGSGQTTEDKENDIPETVSLDTEPYDGPSKLAQRVQNVNYEAGTNMEPQKAQASNTLIKVPSENSEDKSITQNRTFTADSDYHQSNRDSPKLGSYVSPEQAAELNKKAEDRY